MFFFSLILRQFPFLSTSLYKIRFFCSIRPVSPRQYKLENWNLLWQWGTQRLITYKKIAQIGRREETLLRKYNQNLNRTKKLQFTHIDIVTPIYASPTLVAIVIRKISHFYWSSLFSLFSTVVWVFRKQLSIELTIYNRSYSNGHFVWRTLLHRFSRHTDRTRVLRSQLFLSETRLRFRKKFPSDSDSDSESFCFLTPIPIPIPKIFIWQLRFQLRKFRFFRIEN